MCIYVSQNPENNPMDLYFSKDIFGGLIFGKGAGALYLEEAQAYNKGTYVTDGHN